MWPDKRDSQCLSMLPWWQQDIISLAGSDCPKEQVPSFQLSGMALAFMRQGRNNHHDEEN
ncbi:rCG59473 [Rattus norvegicus]|uniref:RCG59473 n=1 Tax=Rattus norvegicus TaxID=10116 RepID=A6HRA6_RAT|nr:rCG59473 [Rattus norvegicus]